MDDLFYPGESEATGGQLQLAVIDSITTAGTTLILDGQSTAGAKRYKTLRTGTTLRAGDRVLVAKLSGTYVVLGKIT